MKKIKFVKIGVLMISLIGGVNLFSLSASATNNLKKFIELIELNKAKRQTLINSNKEKSQYSNTRIINYNYNSSKKNEQKLNFDILSKRINNIRQLRNNINLFVGEQAMLRNKYNSSNYKLTGILSKFRDNMNRFNNNNMSSVINIHTKKLPEQKNIKKRILVPEHRKISNFVDKINIRWGKPVKLNSITKKLDAFNENNISSINSFTMQKNKRMMNTVGFIDNKKSDYIGFSHINDITFENMKNIKILKKGGWLYLDLNGVRQNYRYIGRSTIYSCLPELQEVMENEPVQMKYKFRDVKGKTVIDPQYEVKIEDGQTNYIFNGSLKYFKKNGEKIYQDTKGYEFEKLPPADDFENRYEVIEDDGKIYYKGYDGVVYEVVPRTVTKETKDGQKETETRLSYQIDGKEKFYSIKGKEGYFMPRKVKKKLS